MSGTEGTSTSVLQYLWTRCQGVGLLSVYREVTHMHDEQCRVYVGMLYLR